MLLFTRGLRPSKTKAIHSCSICHHLYLKTIAQQFPVHALLWNILLRTSKPFLPPAWSFLLSIEWSNIGWTTTNPATHLIASCYAVLCRVFFSVQVEAGATILNRWLALHGHAPGKSCTKNCKGLHLWDIKHGTLQGEWKRTLNERMMMMIVIECHAWPQAI